MANQLPQISVLGAGIFVKTQYIPRLAEISHLFVLKSIWSRSEVIHCLLLISFLDYLSCLYIYLHVQESAREAVEVAKEHFPGVECKWGDKGLDEIIQDESILGVAVVLAAQYQVCHQFCFSIQMLIILW
jgi:hypothetical protein